MVEIFADLDPQISEDGTVADFSREVSAHRPKRPGRKSMAWVELTPHGDVMGSAAARLLAHELLCAAAWAEGE